MASDKIAFEKIGHILELEIAEYIDDLLVEQNLEQPRKFKQFVYIPVDSRIWNITKPYQQEKIKENPRVRVILNFERQRAYFRYKNQECYYNLKSNKIISHKEIPSSRKLIPFVLKAMQKYQAELKSEWESYNELKDYTISKPAEYNFYDDGKERSDISADFAVTHTRTYKDLFNTGDTFSAYGFNKSR